MRQLGRIAVLALLATLLSGDANAQCPASDRVCFASLPAHPWWPTDYCSCKFTVSRPRCSNVSGCCDGVNCPSGQPYFIDCVEDPPLEDCVVGLEPIGTPPPPAQGTPGPTPPCPGTGRPVSITTGEMYFTHTDAVVGRIAITRSYNSARTTTGRHGAFGPGWNASFDQRLRVISTAGPNSPQALELRLTDGTPMYYVIASATATVYTQDVPHGKDSWIEETPTGYRRTLRRGGGAEEYDSNGPACIGRRALRPAH
jgi:hypothetical protein